MFDDQHFSCAQITVHSTLLDFRWRSVPSQAAMIKAMPGAITSAPPKRKDAAAPPPEDSKLPQQPTSLAEYLFMDDRGRLSETVALAKVN